MVVVCLGRGGKRGKDDDVKEKKKREKKKRKQGGKGAPSFIGFRWGQTAEQREERRGLCQARR